MGTRFYFPSSGDAPIAPDFSGDWWDSSQGDRRKTSRSKTNTSLLFISRDTSLGEWTLARQYISDPIGGGTISGTIKGQFRAFRDSPNDAYLVVIVRLLSNDGETDKGVIGYLRPFNDTILAESTARNCRLVCTIESPVIADDGDRLAFEVGFDMADEDGSCAVGIGDNNSNDLPEDNTTTTAGNPWIEFSSFINEIESSSSTSSDSLSSESSSSPGHPVDIFTLNCEDFAGMTCAQFAELSCVIDPNESSHSTLSESTQTSESSISSNSSTSRSSGSTGTSDQSSGSTNSSGSTDSSQSSPISNSSGSTNSSNSTGTSDQSSGSTDSSGSTNSSNSTDSSPSSQTTNSDESTGSSESTDSTSQTSNSSQSSGTSDSSVSDLSSESSQ